MSYIHTIKKRPDQIARLGSVDEVVYSLARKLKRSIKCKWAGVYLVDNERREFLPARVSGMQRRFVKQFHEMPLNADKIPLLKHLLKKKHYLFITDAAKSELLPHEYQQMLRHLSILAVPMVVRNRLIGATFVTRHSSSNHFNDMEIAIIHEMVAYAALSVSHIRLFDESLDMALDMAKRVDVILTLDEINKTISSSLSPTTIIETSIAQIERIISCNLIAMLEGQEGYLTVKAVRARGIETPPALYAGKTIKGHSLASSAFRKGESCYLPSLSNVTLISPLDRSLAKAGIRSLLAIPLSAKDRVRGVLLLGETKIGQFMREDTFTIEKIASQMAVALENARMYEEMRDLFINTVSSLLNAMDAKSPWTKGHSERVMTISAKIASEMGLSDEQVERVRLCGLLHDIGKIGIIESILDTPDILSEEDIPSIKLHSEKGVAILAPIKQLHDILPCILSHHERIDGSGYPQGLKGDEIPLEARIISIADSFDAMVSDRPYKAKLSPLEALNELERGAGTLYDSTILECFSRYMRSILPSEKGPKGRAAKPKRSLS